MLMIASLLSGLVFGAGLLISGMVKPTKVLAFLDIFGAWDPSLAVVMVAALAVSAPGFMLASGRSRPLLAAQSGWPTKNQIDRPLIVGAGLFGVGWGLVGLCPGAGLRKPCDAVARRHRLCCGHGGRHDSSKHLATIPGDNIARKSARHRRRRMSQTLGSPMLSSHADLARCSAAEVLPGNPARASPP